MEDLSERGTYEYRRTAVNAFLEKKVQHVDFETYHAIGELLQSKTIFEKQVAKEEEEEEMDMCKALEDLYQDGVNEGRDDKLKELVAKKLAKNKSVEVIAAELEEDISVIEDIVQGLGT